MFAVIHLSICGWITASLYFKSTHYPTLSPEPVSVIVCCHNEENNIANCLNSILANENYPIEIIVVNDRSSDKTEEIIQQFANKDYRIKIITITQTPANWSPKKWAITQGILSAQYNWLFFTDADCIVPPNWIDEMMKFRKPNTQILLGISPYFEYPTFLNSVIQYETFNTAIQYIGFASAGLPYMGVGRNLAYQKTLFLEKNGFKSHA
ncbi:MAG: glycosyltransferase, partial [Bacteroidia bacterium]|nr:glycosyltransferase [Bacteroidia bacterium]